jgi:hypothetical protein
MVTLGLAALLCSQAFAAAPAQEYWPWYNIESLGVRLRAPSDWMPPESNEEGPYRLLAPDSDESGVTVTVTASRASLPAAVDAARNSLLLLDNPDVTEEKDFTADGKAGHMIGYVAVDQGAPIMGRDYLIASGEQVYSLDAQAYQTVASSYVAVFERIATSFEARLSTETFSASTRAVSDSQWIKRGDAALSVSVRTPKNWKAVRQGGRFLNEPTELFVLNTPEGDETGGSVVITARDEPGAVALRWARKGVAKLPGGRVRGGAPSKSAKGRSAFVLTYSAKVDGADIIGRMSLIRDGERTVVVDCRAKQDRFKEFSGTCEAVTNSLSADLGGAVEESASPKEE